LNQTGFVCLCGLVMLAATHARGAQAGGVFIPRNGGYEGRIGEAHVFIDSTCGGVMEVVSGEWPRLERIARVEMVFAVAKEGVAEPAEVRQSFDRSPEIIFVEEGNDRIGVRVKCELYDAQNLYHGHAMTETWMYPNGEMFATVAAAFEDRLAHTGVTDARTNVELLKAYTTALLGTEPPVEVHLASLREPRTLAFSDDALPGRCILLSAPTGPPLGLYWRTGKMAHWTVIYREEKGAPTYYRWPDYPIQAYPGGATVQAVRVSQSCVELRWLPKGAGQAQNATATFSAFFRLAPVPDMPTLRAFVEAERTPVELAVEGGVVHGPPGGYNDQDGSYEVRKTANPMVVTLPADPAGRTIRVKAIALSGHGAVTAKLNGQPVVPHLASEGGIADDPLAPIREQPEGPADMALVTVKLGDEPQTLTFSEEPGVQYAYQTRDPWRNVCCFTSKGGGRHAGFKFSLVDGRARNMRAYGQSEWALTENLLTWFSWGGFTPEQMIDDVVDFQVLKNGPDEAIFRYVSENANGRAQSEYIVRVPANSPAMQINVTATLTVRESWPYDNCQFFDVFPFRGVWPQDWWYDEVLWLAPDGRTKWMRTIERTYGGDEELEMITGGGFFALYRSGRGNMLMLTKNFEPALPTSYVICANYIDFHMAVKFSGADGKPAPPERGSRFKMQYDLALWGDETVTREQLIEIGRKSIEAGRLLLPGEQVPDAHASR